MQARFDPFTDRRSRDIRNLLTESLVTAAEQHKLALVQSAAQDLLARHRDPVYQDYIHDRLVRYQQIWPVLTAVVPGDNLSRALILWRGHLFFEVHAFLEAEWLNASGARRHALQALIQAAAVYVHREFGHTRAAARLAAKALDSLTASRMELAAIANLEELLQALEDPQAPPPLLQIASAP